MAYYVREDESNATFFAVLAAGLVVLVGFMIFAFTQLTTHNTAVTETATNDNLLPDTQVIEVVPPAENSTHTVEITPSPVTNNAPPATSTTNIDVAPPAADNGVNATEETAPGIQ